MGFILPLGIAGKMMGGVEVKELDEMSKSAIDEPGNVMTGNAAARFEKQNMDMDISRPTVLTGQGITIGWPLHRALALPLHTEVGDMIVWVCLEERKENR